MLNKKLQLILLSLSILSISACGKEANTPIAETSVNTAEGKIDNATLIKQYYASAIDKGNKGDYEGSLQDFEKVTQLDPQNQHAFRGIGNAQDNLKRFKEAITNYSKAISIDPTYVEAIYNRAIGYKIIGEEQLYERDIESIKKIDPNGNFKPAVYESLLIKGYDLNQSEKHKEAKGAFNDALKIVNNSSEAYLGRGVSQLLLGDFDSAYADFSKAIEIEPKNYIAYKNRAYILKKKNMFNEAIDDANKAISIYAKDASYFYLRASIYLSLKKYPEALADYNSTLEIDPNFKAAYYDRSIVRYELGDKEGAKQDVQKWDAMVMQSKNQHVQK